MNISSLYGKKVLSTAGKSGYVISVNVAGGRIECLTCADENENEFYVDMRSVLKTGDKILFEDRESAIKAAKPVRLGRASYDDNGMYLGNLVDMTYTGGKILKAKIGKKSYPASGLVCGDVVIAKTVRTVKSDVVKDGKVIIKKGTPLTDGVLLAAEKEGEYVQANLKSL